MITNIIDRRKRPYRFLKVNAIVEAAWHDNPIEPTKDADRVRVIDEGPDYEEREHITLAEAVIWATSFPQQVTLFLYDEDGGIYERSSDECACGGGEISGHAAECPERHK